MRILIYGLGKGVDYITRVLRNEHEIVGYSDSYAKISQFDGVKFYKRSELPDAVKLIDYIIISIRNKKVANTVANELAEDLSIDENIIIPFYSCADSEKWIHELSKNGNRKIDGIILGNSLAGLGILSEMMPINLLNIAARSQDIFGNLMSFHAVRDNFHGELSLDYLVFDLMSSHYLNYDASIGKTFFSSIMCGSFVHPHNFSLNSNFSGTFEENLKNECGIDRLCNKKKVIMNELFCENIAVDIDDDEKNYSVLGQNSTFAFDWTKTRYFKQKSEATINENMQIIELVIKQAYELNSGVKIYFSFLPTYKEFADIYNSLSSEWNNQIMEFLNTMKNRYGVHILDLRDTKEISENRRFYRDNIHLNYIGAKCMTSILCEKMGLS